MRHQRKSLSVPERHQRKSLSVPERHQRKSLSVPERHQLKIARQTLRMPDEMVAILGGMNKAEARAIILRLTGRAPKEYRRVMNASE